MQNGEAYEAGLSRAPIGLQLDAAPKGKERKAAQTLLEKAEAKLSKYRSRLSAMHSSETVPKVEVGCLEEVISRMEADADGEWGSVMFIPAGNLQSTLLSTTGHCYSPNCRSPTANYQF